jgi:hypothetical protein
MNSDRIKEIQQSTAYPESLSVKQALLQVWNECEQQDNWISVEDRLPENHELVNIILNSGAITVGRISSKFTNWICFTIKGVLNLQVTHWQPLPNPPNK